MKDVKRLGNLKNMVVDLKQLFEGDKDAYTAHEMINKYGEAGSAFEVQKDGKTWEGREVAIKGEPLLDSGTGKKLYIRNWEFQKNPIYKGRELTNQELFNWHWKELERFIWADGLRIVESEPPRVSRFPNGKYVITIVCEPRFGINAFDDSYTLQQFLPPKSLPKKK